MATGWTTFPIEVSGGLVTNLPPIQQGMKLSGSARRLVNFEPSIDGGYRRINGFSKWSPVAVPAITNTNIILGVGLFNGDVVAAREDKVFVSSGSTWTEIAAGRTHSGKHRFHTYNFSGTRKIIGVDSTDHPYTYDGVSFTEITGSPDVTGASHAVSFKDHMFYAKGSLLTFSEPFIEGSFSVANGAGSLILKGDITGLHVFRDRLFIFTEHDISVLDGSSLATFSLTSVSNDVGCIREDTIQEVAGDIVFLSADGVRTLGATSRIGDFENASSSKQVQSEANRYRRSHSTFCSTVLRDKSQYRLMGFVSGQDPDFSVGLLGAQLTEDSSDFDWAETTGIKAYSADSAVYNATEQSVFSNDTDFVYLLDTGSSFDGLAIKSSYWTPYLAITDPTLRKTFYKIDVYISAENDICGDMALEYDQNETNKIQPASMQIKASGGGAVFGTAVWGSSFFGSKPNSRVQKQLIGSGFNVSFKFDFVENQSPFTIDTLAIEYKQDDRK